MHRSSPALWPRLLGLEELTAVLAAAALTKSGSVRDSGSGWREVSCSIPMARRGRGSRAIPPAQGLGDAAMGCFGDELGSEGQREGLVPMLLALLGGGMLSKQLGCVLAAPRKYAQFTPSPLSAP